MKPNKKTRMENKEMSNRNIEIKTMIKINGIEITSSDSRSVSLNMTEDNVLEIKNALLNSNLSFIKELIMAEERAALDQTKLEISNDEGK